MEQNIRGVLQEVRVVRVPKIVMRTILRRGNLASFFMGCFFSLIFISTHRWLAERNQSNQNIQLNSTKKLALVFGDSITQHGFNPRDKG